MKDDERPLMVTILCTAYNHERYIRQCLEGFIMQQTNFRFEAIVHDDASTDATASIIREYAIKYPHIIKPILQTENQYSQGKKIGVIMEQRFPFGKYIAECEGDDYWINPNKLQQQVDFLQRHQEYAMVCNRTRLYSEQKKQFVGENCCYDHSQTINVKDIILKGGLFLSTCSLLYRKSMMPPELPDYWVNCHVGDYPLQIQAAMKGKVYYFHKAMSVYRIDNSTSWTGRKNLVSMDRHVAAIKSEVNMLKGFAADNPQYRHLFWQRIMIFINTQYPYRQASREALKSYREAFEDEIEQYTTLARLDLWLRSSRFYLVRMFRPYKFMTLLKKLGVIYLLPLLLYSATE